MQESDAFDSRSGSLVPFRELDLDDTELVVRVADEIGNSFEDNDPFLESSDRPTYPGVNVSSPPFGDSPSVGESKGAKKSTPEDDEPEWMFIGGSQRHKTSSTNISAETSSFIMKKKSVTRTKESSETQKRSNAEGHDIK